MTSFMDGPLLFAPSAGVIYDGSLRGKTRENNCMCAQAATVTSAEEGFLSIFVGSFLWCQNQAFFGETLALAFLMLLWRGLALGTRLRASSPVLSTFFTSSVSLSRAREEDDFLLA